MFINCLYFNLFFIFIFCVHANLNINVNDNININHNIGDSDATNPTSIFDGPCKFLCLFMTMYSYI